MAASSSFRERVYDCDPDISNECVETEGSENINLWCAQRSNSDADLGKSMIFFVILYYMASSIAKPFHYTFVEKINLT